MTQELPPLINKQYNTNGRNAVAGLSSTGGTAVDYAIQAPGLYRAVGSYSGFLTPNSGSQNVGITLIGGGASADAMWGPPGGPLWVAHDPSLNVSKLKGVAVWVGASGGGQGDVDRLPPGANNITGGMIEGIVADSTRQFADAAKAAGVPITYVVRPRGLPLMGPVRVGDAGILEHHYRTGARGLIAGAREGFVEINAPQAIGPLTHARMQFDAAPRGNS